MMRAKATTTGLSQMNGRSSLGGANNVGRGGGESGDEWEVRPGGMLVQKRNLDSDRNSALPPRPPPIRVRVKHGSTYHEISINSQATFGELKRMLTGPTGLHHQDQKLIFKDKERDSNAFLDVVGVKDRSKIVLVEDPISQEKRYLEMRRNAKMEKASKSISEISLEVDRLAGQVSAMESVISRGGNIAETKVLTLIEMLMNQLLKLDGIVADGDVKLQRKMQVKRVQKCVETLDMLKIKNSMQGSNNVGPVGLVPVEIHEQAQQHASNGAKTTAILQPQQRPRHLNGHSQTQEQGQAYHHSNHHYNQQKQREREQEEEASSRSTSGTVVTTKWETFDPTPPSMPALVASSASSSPNATTTNNSVHPRFNWELFE